MEQDISHKELIRKYKLAGKIRFISFALLFLFLLLMKTVGGRSYLNEAFILMIVVEAVLNQPYGIIIRRVNLKRFQYYQMVTDIIVISWILYYMGGIDAPVVSIAYYAVILWAGVVSTTQAVLFAVITSAVFFSAVVLFEYFGFIPEVAAYNYKMPAGQMVTLLISNISFLFAFGYFSAHSSAVIQYLQRKRQGESLRNVHRLTATGYLLGGATHDLLNDLSNIKGYARLLLEGSEEGTDDHTALAAIAKLGDRSANLLVKLGRFSRTLETKYEPVEINQTINDALELVYPISRYGNIKIENEMNENIPSITANKYALQEVFVVVLMGALDHISGSGRISIETSYEEDKGRVRIVFLAQGSSSGNSQDVITSASEEMRGAELAWAAAMGIIDSHKGEFRVKEGSEKVKTVTINLPIDPKRGISGK